MPNTATLWITLDPGVIFRFDNKLYLRTAHRIISLEDFGQIGLHADVKVEPVGKIQVTGSHAHIIVMVSNEKVLKNYKGYTCRHCGGGHRGTECTEDWLRY